MNTQEVGYSFIGAILSVSVGSLLLQGLGALIIGLLGALGGWLFAHFLKPRLEKLFKRLTK